MRLDKAGDIGEIFETLALPLPRLGPGLHFAFESILETSHSYENTMYVSGDGMGWEIPVEILCA
jgi:hypothetical protein